MLAQHIALDNHYGYNFEHTIEYSPIAKWNPSKLRNSLPFPHVIRSICSLDWLACLASPSATSSKYLTLPSAPRPTYILLKRHLTVSTISNAVVLAWRLQWRLTQRITNATWQRASRPEKPPRRRSGASLLCCSLFPTADAVSG
ncbi:hypothetical protein CSAL01_04930 [Colletotrichum salicis]|uniref:Uncharacterized protein n=1 Tax=Colletotrichum salicis TaxID=1209931 RepID=A0A135SY50_9PEZI|nr:hypothetical protein CSAL01_04930 [Colletotrichum salicis]